MNENEFNLNNTEIPDKAQEVLDEEPLIQEAEQPVNENNQPTEAVLDFSEEENSTSDFEYAARQNSDNDFEENETDFNTGEKGNLNFEGEPAMPVLEFEQEATDNKKGLRVFIFLLCAVIALSAAVATGYYIGKYGPNNTSGGNNSLTLEEKPTDEAALTAEQVYDSVNRSIVGITVYNASGVSGYASGVVYSEDGYIITNDHIYSEVFNAEFKIHTYDGTVYDAKFVAGDTRSDLAVLKVDADGFFPATFGNSDELAYGEEVVAIGRPNDATADSSITSGIISFLNRRVANASNYSSKFIQTDSAINPGSSGGALVNMYGQVIGITSAKVVGDQYEGIGYAIPTVTVKRVVENLIANGKVIDRAKLGVSYQEIDEITAEHSNNYGAAGLYVATVAEESDLYGKVEAGEIITAVNDIAITKDDILLDIIENAKPGDTLKITVYTSSGKYKTVQAKLIADDGGSSYTTTNEEPSLLPEDDRSDGSGGTFDFPYGY